MKINKYTEDIRNSHDLIAIQAMFSMRRLDMQGILSDEIKKGYEDLCVYLENLLFENNTG